MGTCEIDAENGSLLWLNRGLSHSVRRRASGYRYGIRAVKAQALRQTFHTDRVVVFSDSQASLQALVRPMMPSGQMYLASYLNHLHWLKLNSSAKVGLRWIPAYSDIPGNE